MFSWLRRWGRPNSAGESSGTIRVTHARAPAPPPLPIAAPAPRPSFLEQLEGQAAPIEPLTPEQDEQIAALVVQVVEHACRRKIDPPVMPALVPRVLAIVGEPEVDIVKLSRVIEQDLAIGSKLLSVANSPVFGASHEVATVRDAVQFLGTEQVAQVAIGLACASQYQQEQREPTSPLRARWARLFQHGVSTAFCAVQLASKFDRHNSEQAFLGGLFHDVGKAVALRAIEALIKEGKLSDTSELLWDEALHRIHAYPGDEFYRKWTLPAPLMRVCAEHHQLEELSDAPPLLYCVSLASSFDALLYGSSPEQHEALNELATCARKLSLSDAQLRTTHTQANTLVARARSMFG